MAWKSSFRQYYRTTFSPTVPPSAARISRVWWRKWEHLKTGESNEVAQDAAYQNQTSRLTELWSLPKPAQGLNTYNNNNNNNTHRDG